MEPKTGVILLNMGGPEQPQDVAQFLFNLFSDREIIRLGPRLLQKPLAWIIAKKRAPKSLAIYNQIGGGSPLIAITKKQAAALEQALESTGQFSVVTAMRYSNPSAHDALQKLDALGISKIVALPLYPHYCKATSGSSLNDLRRAQHKINRDIELLEIGDWSDNSLYVQCLAEKIHKGLLHFNNEPVTVVYSAHSLPTSFIAEGDPYVDELTTTITLVEEITKLQGKLCYQSRSGPVEWLSPSTPDMLNMLAQDGCHNILMVPISFVSDHIETLYEVNILYRQMALDLGMTLHSTESLGTTPLFIETLKNLVINRLAEDKDQ